MKNAVAIILFTLALSTVVSAGLAENLNNVCVQAKGMMPLVAFTLIVFAGLIYAVGQIIPSEMRSRTVVWSTTMVIGAIIGLIFMASAPYIIQLAASSFGADIENYEYKCEQIIE